jgi:hypothetical protein
VNIEKIHEPAVFDTNEASELAALVSDKDSSGAKAIGPGSYVRSIRGPGRDLVPIIVSRTDLTHRSTEAAHHCLKVIFYVRANHGASLTPNVSRSAAAKQRAKARCEAVRCIGWLGGSMRTMSPQMGGIVTVHTARWSAERSALVRRGIADTSRSLG